MVQGYPQKNSGSSGGWCSLGSTIGIRAVFPFRGNPGKEGQSFSPCSTQIPEAGQRSGDASRAYIRGADLEQWPAYPPKRSGLSGSVPSDPKAGGPMLSVTGINRFYYLRGFTDMRCKHSRVLSVIREQLHREPSDGDIYIVMSKDRRIVRLFAYDNRSYSLFEKKFVAGYQFMRIIKDDEGNEVAYRIDWKDVVLLLENPVIKSLKIR